MHDAGGVSGGQRRRDLDRDIERFLERPTLSPESRSECLARDVFHRDELLPVRCFTEGVDRADVRVIEAGRGARFLPKANQSARIPREIGCQKLQCDRSFKLEIAREVDLAHAPGSEPANHFVVSEACAHENLRVALAGLGRCPVDSTRRGLEEFRCGTLRAPAATRSRAGATHRHRTSREGRQLARPAAGPAPRRRCGRSDASAQAPWGVDPLSSRSNQTLASLQSRVTVSGEILRTVAVSSILRPPKNRSSTTRLRRWSIAASASSASSSATRSVGCRHSRRPGRPA